jgi:hypothetical protein
VESDGNIGGWRLGKRNMSLLDNCHSPTLPQHELELDLIMGRNPHCHLFRTKALSFVSYENSHSSAITWLNNSNIIAYSVIGISF